MSGDESFDVEPEDVKKAGHNATEIGDRLLRARGDLLDQAGGVSRGIDGFALTGALRGCAQAWEDELGSAGRATRGAGEELLRTAHTYEQADASGRRGFGATAGALGQPPG